jgi:site-specific recombinase XerD
MSDKFSQFIRERQYLQNVSPATLEWYKHSFKWLRTENPTEEGLKDVVIRMRGKGLKPTGCNSAIRAINAYLKWIGSPHRVLYLKEDQRVLPTFTLPDIKKLVSYKPKNFYQRRLHLLALVLSDTGCRIDEVLSLRTEDCDLDNLLFTVTGKGRKQRKIPFSFELRRHLSRFLVDLHSEQLIFATRHGRKLGRRNVLRDVKLLCRRLGVAPPERTLHAFRHTFALHYLRKGGSVFHLQKVLGHSTLEMTRRYANLLTEDLQAIHQKISLLAA